MAVITRLDWAAVEAALSPYAVGKVDALKEASEGIENTNYFVRVRDSANELTEYVLTLIEEIGLTHDRDGMIRILDCCTEAGLPVPRLIRTQAKLAESEFQGKPVLLCSRLNGSHVANPIATQCEAIGRFLARFHDATHAIQEDVQQYARDEDWLVAKTELVAPHMTPFNRYLLETTLRTVQDLLTRSDTQTLRTSVIHADLFRDNALFNEYGLCGVLDFHHAGRGTCVYDLAVALNDWCRDGTSLDESLAMRLLRGYSSIRPLQSLEMWLLPTFLLYAALSFWLSRLVISVRTDLPDHYPIKDPDEFRDLVQQHTTNPFAVVQEALA